MLDLAFFQKVSPKSTVYTLSLFAFLGLKKFFLRFDFLMNFRSILNQSNIVYRFSRKQCLIWPFFKKYLLKVQCIHCLYLHFWGQKCVWQGTFFWSIFVRFCNRVPMCNFLAKKTAWFCHFPKRCSKKYSVYTISKFIFKAKKVSFEVRFFQEF